MTDGGGWRRRCRLPCPERASSSAHGEIPRRRRCRYWCCDSPRWTARRRLQRGQTRRRREHRSPTSPVGTGASIGRIRQSTGISAGETVVPIRSPKMEATDPPYTGHLHASKLLEGCPTRHKRVGKVRNLESGSQKKRETRCEPTFPHLPEDGGDSQLGVLLVHVRRMQRRFPQMELSTGGGGVRSGRLVDHLFKRLGGGWKLRDPVIRVRSSYVLTDRTVGKVL